MSPFLPTLIFFFSPLFSNSRSNGREEVSPCSLSHISLMIGQGEPLFTCLYNAIFFDRCKHEETGNFTTSPTEPPRHAWQFHNFRFLASLDKLKDPAKLCTHSHEATAGPRGRGFFLEGVSILPFSLFLLLPVASPGGRRRLRGSLWACSALPLTCLWVQIFR